MTRTTVYLPDDLKARLTREARRRRVSEAEVVRGALEATLDRPRPGAGLFSGPPIAARTDELLAGFGER